MVNLSELNPHQILCSASKYTRKFFWNPDFQDCPKELQQEMQILCVMFTEEVGGIVIVYFDDNGSITMVSSGEEDDPYFDRIGSGLKLEQVKEKSASSSKELKHIISFTARTLNGTTGTVSKGKKYVICYRRRKHKYYSRTF